MDKENLIAYLDREFRILDRWAWRHHMLGVFSLAVAALASISSTLSEGKILAAIPAAIIVVYQLFKFEEKSRWYWKYARGYERLLRNLRYRNVAVDVVAAELNDFDEQMTKEIPTFGRIPGKEQILTP